MNADKRRAVEMLLRDEEWSTKSDRWIAERCRVDHKTVAAHRSQLGNSPVEQPKRTGRDGKQYPATKAKKPDSGSLRGPDGNMLHSVAQ